MNIPKWLVNTLGALLVILVAILIVGQGNSVINTIKNTKPANTIAVSGEGKVTVTPDLATVDIGVMTQGSTAADVTSQNNTKINKVIAFVKSQGIAAADISTSQLSLYPQQSYPVVEPMMVGGTPIKPSTPTITGYEGDQTITVKVHGVDKDTSVLDKILDGAVINGANEINDVNLSVEDPSSIQQQAQVKAIADAKQKAQALAQEAGLTLGKVVNVSETQPAVFAPMPYALNSAMSAGGGAASVAPNIQTGSQEIDETMTVTFEVK
jgi:uncharacterized protein YggE